MEQLITGIHHVTAIASNAQDKLAPQFEGDREKIESNLPSITITLTNTGKQCIRKTS